MVNLVPIWVILHTAVLFTCIAALFTLFRNPAVSMIANFSIIALYTLCMYNELNFPGGFTLGCVFRNYSFHILTMTAFFQIFGIRPLQWYIAFGFASFFQLLNYILTKNSTSQNKVIGWMRTLFMKLTNPPIAFQLLATFEIMTTMQIGVRGSVVKTLIGTTVYGAWFLMFRYEFDTNHKLIWSSLRQSIQGLAAKCPQFIAKLLYSLAVSLEPLGRLAHQIYGQKVHTQ